MTDISSKSTMKRIATLNPQRAADELEQLRNRILHLKAERSELFIERDQLKAALVSVKSDIKRRMNSDDACGHPFDEDLADAINTIETALALTIADQSPTLAGLDSNVSASESTPEPCKIIENVESLTDQIIEIQKEVFQSLANQEKGQLTTKQTK